MILQKLEAVRNIRDALQAFQGVEVAFMSFLAWFSRCGIQLLPLSPYVPSIIDICLLPRFLYDRILPASHFVTHGFMEIVPPSAGWSGKRSLYSIFAALARSILHAFTAVAYRRLPAQIHVVFQQHPDLLRLACVWFSIPTESGQTLGPLRWQEAWRQVCFDATSPRYEPPTPVHGSDTVKCLLWSRFGNHIPSVQRIATDVRLDKLAYRKVVEILRLLGLSTHLTLDAHMDALGYRFACLVCGFSMGWRRLVSPIIPQPLCCSRMLTVCQGCPPMPLARPKGPKRPA